MERVFSNILRWLGLTMDESCFVRDNYAEKRLSRSMFWVLFSSIQENDALYHSLESYDCDEIAIKRREFIDGYWTQCKLSIKREPDTCLLSYTRLGYEALVNGNVVLVDSITSLKDLGD